MLLNENRAVRVPPYRKAVATSVPRSVETALYGIHVLIIPHYRRTVAISTPTLCENRIISKLRSENAAL